MIELMKNLLSDADKDKYAVVAFNYSDLWDLKGIIRAAEAERSPVIIQMVPPVVDNFNVQLLSVIGNTVAEQAKVPVVNHLDHCVSLEMCKSAIDAGFSSVMIDASSHAFEENVRITRSIVDYAHGRGVHVEGELGRIYGSGWEGVSAPSEGNYYTTVEGAVKFVEQTNVDSLAISIGSSHGYYKSAPKLNLERLAEINAVVDTRLVLHGGTGIPEKSIRKAIENGINKINVGTKIYTTYLSIMRNELKKVEGLDFDLNIHEEAVEAVAGAAASWLRRAMASGKAT